MLGGNLSMLIISTVQMDAPYRKNLKEAFPQCIFVHTDLLSSLSDNELAEAEVLITYGQDVSTQMMKKMSNLNWIHIFQVGIETLPFDTLIEQEIVVTNSKGVNSVAIAEYTMGMMLNLVRSSFTFYDAQKDRIWETETQFDELSSKTLGILGYGSIGKELAKRAKAFDMNVLALKRTVEKEIENVDALIKHSDKHLLFEKSDFIVVLLPLTEETINFIDEEEFKKLKSTAYLINVSRGQVINEQSLIHHLRSRTFAGAALDVFNEEPLQEDHLFWGLDNVLITPHVAGERFQSYMLKAFTLTMENLRSYIDHNGEMINRIDLNKRY